MYEQSFGSSHHGEAVEGNGLDDAAGADMSGLHEVVSSATIVAPVLAIAYLGGEHRHLRRRALVDGLVLHLGMADDEDVVVESSRVGVAEHGAEVVSALRA